MNKWSVLIVFLFGAALTACGPSNSTQGAPQTDQDSATATATLVPPTSTSTATDLPPTPTATPTPANFRADNFSEFAQTRSYYQEIQALLGENIRSMRWDAVALSPDGRFAAIGGCTANWSGGCQSRYTVSDSFLFILDTLTGDIVAEIPEKDTDITSLAFTPDGQQLIYTTMPVRIVVWDIPSGQVARVIHQEGSTYWEPSMVLSPDGSQIAAAYDQSLRVWDAATGGEITHQRGDRSGYALPRYSADGSRLAVFTNHDGDEIAVYDTTTWERISLIQLPYETRLVAFSPDGTTLLTADEYKETDVLFWDVDTSAQAGSLGAAFDSVETLDFSPDGKLLIIFCWSANDNVLDGITVWDAATHQMLGVMFTYLWPRGTLFSADQTSLLFVDETLPLVYRWTLPDAAILAARQTAFDFLAALSIGDYETAAGFYQPFEDYLLHYESLGLDPGNLPAVLEYICNQPSQPCSLTVDDILYEGQEDDGYYSLYLSFTTPDGVHFIDEYGSDKFSFYISLDEMGTASILSLPDFLYPQ